MHIKHIYIYAHTQRRRSLRLAVGHANRGRPVLAFTRAAKRHREDDSPLGRLRHALRIYYYYYYIFFRQSCLLFRRECTRVLIRDETRIARASKKKNYTTLPRVRASSITWKSPKAARVLNIFPPQNSVWKSQILVRK